MSVFLIILLYNVTVFITVIILIEIENLNPNLWNIIIIFIRTYGEYFNIIVHCPQGQMRACTYAIVLKQCKFQTLMLTHI